MKSSVKDWGRIVWPIAAYLVLSAGLRFLLMHAADLTREAAASWTTICLFLPVSLLYLRRWRTADTAGSNAGTPGRLQPVWWIVSAISLAAASAGLFGLGGAQEAGSAGAVLSTCLLGPFTEEVLYRGQFFGRGLGAIRPVPLLLMSTLLFAAAHGAVQQMLIAIPAGLILGLLYLHEKRLTGVVVTHCAANLLICCGAGTALAANPVLLIAALIAEAVIAGLLYKRVFGRTQ